MNGSGLQIRYGASYLVVVRFARFVVDVFLDDKVMEGNMREEV